MSRLKDRNKFIPNGFVFYQPETGWQPQRMQSFETIVQGIIAHRNANPWLKEKNGWPVDTEAVREELDAYNSKVCEHMGWRDYISAAGASAPPLPQPPHSRLLQTGRAVVAGAATLVDWGIENKAQAVSPEVSSERARICSECPKNGKGDLLSYFTKPAAEAIRKTIEFKDQIELSTPYDDVINVCEACDCPLRLKVHLPITNIRSKMSTFVKSELDQRCWILWEKE